MKTVLIILPLVGLFFLVSGFLPLLFAPPSRLAISSIAYENYFIRHKEVYYCGDLGTPNLIQDAIPKTFQVLTARFGHQELSSLYARDSERVYFKGKPVPGADPVSFKVLGYDLGCDKKSVYTKYQVLTADVKNFKCLDEYLSKDSKNVFFNEEIISGDASHFQFICQIQDVSCYKDRFAVYIGGKSYKVKDIGSFLHLEGTCFKDRFAFYNLDKTGIRESDLTLLTENLKQLRHSGVVSQ
jgi:hypothetical protein